MPELPTPSTESGSLGDAHAIDSGPDDRPGATGSSALIVLAALICLLAWAYVNSFIQDDAFISFRYAANLAHGYGLTWNPGDVDRVEGYTNFLWVVMLAPAIGWGFDPVVVSRFLGLAFACGTLLITFRLAERMLDSRRHALLAMLLLGTNYTFSAYATGGLETQLQTFLITLGAYAAIGFAATPAGCGRYLLLASVACGAALLTRLDSAVPFGLLFAFLTWTIYRLPIPLGRRLGMVALLLMPAALIVAPWLVWKVRYYGDILPNTFYAKTAVSSWRRIRFGMWYVHDFIDSYALAVFIFVALAYARRIWRRVDFRLVSAIVLMWSLYVIDVGGDFMEFRFAVPILPLAFIGIVGMIRACKIARMQVALAAMIVVSSVVHEFSFFGGTIESVGSLQKHIVSPDENWQGIGRRFKDLFGGAGSTVTIATRPCGAVPYYSELRTIDMLGLNDKWIARNGAPLVVNKPGHARIATVEYLLSQKTNLVLGHPFVAKRGDAYQARELDIAFAQYMHSLSEQMGAWPSSAMGIEAPLDDQYSVRMLYLTPSPKVDAAVRTHGLRTFDLPNL